MALLIHARFVVAVVEVSQSLDCIVEAAQHDVGVIDSVKHVCFNGCVVVHIFECEPVALFQRPGEIPAVDEIAGKEKVYTHPVLQTDVGG